MDFPTSPTNVSAAYAAGLSPHLTMSFPQSAAAASLAGLQFQQQIQQGDGRLQ